MGPRPTGRRRALEGTGPRRQTRGLVSLAAFRTKSRWERTQRCRVHGVFLTSKVRRAQNVQRLGGPKELITLDGRPQWELNREFHELYCAHVIRWFEANGASQR